LSTQRLRQSLLQLLNAGGQAGVAGLSVGEVGLERGPADRRSAGRVLGCRFELGGMDDFEEVAMAIEEAAIHSGLPRDGRDADRGAVLR
jgi:hypothetical protein